MSTYLPKFLKVRVCVQYEILCKKHKNVNDIVIEIIRGINLCFKWTGLYLIIGSWIWQVFKKNHATHVFYLRI